MKKKQIWTFCYFILIIIIIIILNALKWTVLLPPFIRCDVS